METRLGRTRAERLARRIFDVPNSRLRYYARPGASEAIVVDTGDGVLHLLTGEHVRTERRETAA